MSTEYRLTGDLLTQQPVRKEGESKVLDRLQFGILYELAGITASIRRSHIHFLYDDILDVRELCSEPGDD